MTSFVHVIYDCLVLWLKSWNWLRDGLTIKAFSPSPYINGMLTSKIPSKQYAISSSRVVTRREAQDIRCAME